MKPEIFVASAIMGGGKSSGARSFCMENPHTKYIYISPFLDESKKFAEDCAMLHFIEPDYLSEFDRSKIKHISHLVEEGRNISSTHAAFAALPEETLRQISEQGYCLICDETVDAVRAESQQTKDMRILQKAGMLVEEGGMCKFVGDDDYIDDKSLFTDLCRLARSNNIIFDSEQDANGKKESYFYLLLPKELLQSFDKIIILTYLFESSVLCGLLKLYGMDYEYIGIERIDFGNGYMLSKSGTYVPDYVRDLKSRIHIYEYETNPIIGRGRPPKDLNTYPNPKDKIKKSRKEFKPTYNFFNRPYLYKDLYDELRNNQKNFFDRFRKMFG